MSSKSVSTTRDDNSRGGSTSPAASATPVASSPRAELRPWDRSRARHPLASRPNFTCDNLYFSFFYSVFHFFKRFYMIPVSRAEIERSRLRLTGIFLEDNETPVYSYGYYSLELCCNLQVSCRTRKNNREPVFTLTPTGSSWEPAEWMLREDMGPRIRLRVISKRIFILLTL